MGTLPGIGREVNKRDFNKLLDALEPVVRQAFLDSIQKMAGTVSIKAVEEAILAGDTSELIKLLQLDSADFSRYNRALQEAFQAAGDATSRTLALQAQSAGMNTVRATFDATNEAATTFLRNQSSTMLVEVQRNLVENVESFMSSVRQRLEPGATQSVRTTALDLVGRINKSKGIREGGVIGLTPTEAGWADDAYSQLLSKDPSDLKAYMRRSARSKKYDALIESAIESGKPLTQTQASQITSGYRNELLKRRGERVARTETIGAMNEARSQSVDRLVQNGIVRNSDVSLVWDASEDSDTRDSHDYMDGTVRQQGEPFISGLGNRLLYPGDRSSGAPAEDVINCRCFVHQRIDFISAAQAGLG